MAEPCGETCKRAMLCYACSKELGGLNPGDILRCIETDELCIVEATSTTGKTMVKWASNDFAEYTAEQIGELFWIEPKPQWQGLAKLHAKLIAENSPNIEWAIMLTEQALKEKNT